MCASRRACSTSSCRRSIRSNVRAAALRAQGHRVISLGQALPFFPPPRVRAARRRGGAAPGARRALVFDGPGPSIAARRTRRAAGPDVGISVRLRGPGHHRWRQSRLRDRVDDAGEPGRGGRPAGALLHESPDAGAASGAVAVEAPLADQRTYCLTWDDLAPALTPRTRAVVLCNPSNPTGAPVDRRARDTHRAGARRPRHLRHQRRDLHAVRLRRRSLERRIRRRLAPQRRRDRNVLEVVCDDGMAGRLRAGRSRGVRAGDQDSGRDDHLRTDDLADRRRRRGARRVGVSAQFHREFVAAASAGRRAASPRIPTLQWTPTGGGFFAFARVERLHRFDGARHTPARGGARRHDPWRGIRPER